MKKRMLSILLSMCMLISVMPTFASAEDGNQATIGEQEYATLQAAFDAAQNGDTVKLLKNVEHETTPWEQNSNWDNPAIHFGGDNNNEVVTLDLNGFGITSDSGRYTIDISDNTRTGKTNCTLIIVNNGKNASYVDNTSDGSTTIRNYGTLVIGMEEMQDHEMIEVNRGEASHDRNSAVKSEELTSLTIYGGTFNGKDRSVQAYGRTEIFGGMFNKTVESWWWNGDGAESEPGVMNIHGGTFKDAVLANCSTDDNSVQDNQPGKLNIYGGEFHGKVGIGTEYQGEDNNVHPLGDNIVTITGGVFYDDFLRDAVDYDKTTSPEETVTATHVIRSIKNESGQTVAREVMEGMAYFHQVLMDKIVRNDGVTWSNIQSVEYYRQIAENYNEIQTNASERAEHLEYFVQQIYSITELNLANQDVQNAPAHDIGALAQFPNLETLNISNTGITEYTLEVPVKNLSANGLTLTTIAGLMEVAENNKNNAEFFKTARWDLGGSTMVTEKDNTTGVYFVDAIADYFAAAGAAENFIAPTVSNRETFTVTVKDGAETFETLNVTAGGKVDTTNFNKDSYTFAGLYTDADMTEQYTYPRVYANATVYVKWEQAAAPVIKYTITFVVEGVETTVEVEENAMPAYEGTPTKAEDDQYTYTFAGWTPEITVATADATYTANFTAVEKVPEHTHSWAAEWSKDVTHHWHECTDETCAEVSDKAAHDFTNNGLCVCGEQRYTMEIQAENCTVEMLENWGEYLPAGAAVTLKVNPAEGYEFSSLLIFTLPDGGSVEYGVVGGDAVNQFFLKTGVRSNIRVMAYCKMIDYTVTVNQPAEGGTVMVDKTTANIGDTVTVTVTPDENYELNKLLVTDAAGAVITVTDSKFTMPADNVTVTATFKAVENENPDDEGGDTHEHNYTATVTAPTCTNQGYTTYTCECGDTYTDNEVAALGHTGGTATCKDKAVCEKCGEKYGELSAEHTIVDGKCTVCGYSEPSEPTFTVESVTIGEEVQGGVGYVREIKINANMDFTNEYVVIQMTSGTGSDARISIVMVKAQDVVTVSYTTANTEVQVWVASGMPNFTNEDDLGVKLYYFPKA